MKKKQTYSLKLTQAQIDAAVLRVSTLTQGAEERIRRALGSGLSDSELIKVVSQAGWGGSLGGTALENFHVEGRADAVYIRRGDETLKLSGKQLAEIIRRIFTDKMPK